ncbi:MULTISPECIES: sensor domain-containing diguanylate cyclase [unclassified Beijerinckia]|uniref:GGDEF domain-containing protein n=1 Tax=unclassified Beijerinckia TaxID=2638183 RepID=UPI0008974006|nr:MULTISPECIES: sensor domain-containing diguanylate cyclase [unclassified Beijerinckia]MDH7797813.1 diguanylate cyclase (GGDEF)-like protein [Beijerinckia sp. GAS462]SEC99416.1 diguanylate cyclase [Beijerinckia sp. 28-YEA-48]
MPLQNVHDIVSKSPDDRSFRTIRILAVLAGLGLLAFFSHVLIDSRRDTLRFAAQADANLARAIAQDIAMAFESYDLSLKGARLALTEPDLSSAAEIVRQFALFDHSANARYLNRMAIVNVDGRIVADSHRSNPLPTDNLSDQEFFTYQRDATDDALFVSKPLQLRLDNGEWSTVLSRRIIRPDGTFGGIVISSLNLSYFQAMFLNLDMGDQSTFSIIGTDRTIFSRQPFRLREIGSKLGENELFKHYPAKQIGSFERVSMSDQVERIYTYARIPNLPLIVVVSSAKARILAGWHQKAMIMASVLTMLMLALVAAGMLLSREFRLRRRAEMKMTALATRLAYMATRDSLTALANRRSFDDTAAKEWKRAMRDQLPFTLLLIDIDNFKTYNDEYGHLRGDDALISVAACIRKNLKRPADFAARYGGEEFVILLPDTDQSGGHIIAEDIRRSIEIAHLANGAPKAVTASIGITTVVPAHSLPFANAFAAADSALYCAKRLGRNRIEYRDCDLPADKIRASAA